MSSKPRRSLAFATIAGLLILAGATSFLDETGLLRSRIGELLRVLPAVPLLLLGMGGPVIDGMVEAGSGDFALTKLGIVLFYVFPAAVFLFFGVLHWRRAG